jgi:hypothetical protein
MFGGILGASALWRTVLTGLVLSLALAACEIPGWALELPPASPTPTPTPTTDPDTASEGPDAPSEGPDTASEAPGSGSALGGAGQVAVYMGWRDTAGVNAFANWLGQPVWAHDFLDHRQGWQAVADPRAQLPAWGQWVAQDDDRRLVLSVPLLVDASAGDFAGGANGAYDQHFRRLAQSLVAHGLDDTVIRLGWEFNGSTFPWAVDRDQVEDYKRFWRRAVTAMRAVDGADFLFDWCPNITLDATGLPFAELYPGDDTVDIIGLGFYDYYWGHPSASPQARWQWLRDVDNGLADHRDFARAHDKPTSFPEYGLWERGTSVGGGGDNPYFVQQLAEWIADNDVGYHGYNNVRATADHRLTSYPQAQRAFLEAFGA